MFEALREDFDSHGRTLLCAGIWVMIVYRFGRWRYGIAPRWLRMPFSAIYKLAFAAVQMLTGVELPCETVVGRRLRIEHHSDIIVNGDSVLGDDVVLRNGVSIGVRRPGERACPHVGNNVDIGAGAKLLGPIRIGDGARIGANAVVLSDVPPGALAVGVPARIVPAR